MSIVFVVLVGAIFAFTIIGVKSNRSRRHLSGRRIYWLMSGYSFLLFTSAVLAPLLPANELTNKFIDKSDEMIENGQNLYTAAIEGKIDQVDSKYLNEKWDFDYHGQHLSLSLKNTDIISAQVFIERKSMNDGRIEAAYYKTSSYVNAMDISKLENPMKLEITDETLFLSDPKKTVLKFYQFEKAFPITQFTSEGWQGGHHTSFSQGQSILYIKIPKDLELINQFNIYYEMIE